MQGRTLEINSIFHQEIKTNIKPHKALFSGHLTLQALLLCAVPDKALPDPSGSLQRFKVRNEKIILGLRPVGSSLAPRKGFSTGPFCGSGALSQPWPPRSQLSASTCPDSKGKCKPCKGKHLPCPTSIS